MPQNSPRKRWFTGFVFLILFLPAPLLALDFKIRVFDPDSGTGLTDVQVIILETKTRYYTGSDGTVDASVPTPGFYTFRAIVPGGNLVQPRIQVTVPHQLVTVFTSPPKGAQTSTVAGPGQGINVLGNKEKTKLSRYQVRLDEIKRIPGQFGEAMKGLETLPGVMPAAFGTGDIVIRGASANSNTYVVDNLPIGYPFHMWGLNQVVHNDLIKTIDIYTGAYPAQFSNATGGVVSIETNDKVEKFGGHTSFSLFASNALFQAPIKNSNNENVGYWVGAAKVSYFHQLFRAYMPDGVKPPHYFDGQFKFFYRFSPEHSIYFYFLGAKDSVAIRISDKPAWDPTSEPDPIVIGASFAQDVAFHTEAIRYVWQPTGNVQNRLDLINHDNIQYFNGKIGIYEGQQRYHNGYAAVKDEFAWGIYDDNIVLNGGFEMRYFQYRTVGETIHQLDPQDPNPDPYDSVNPDYEIIPIRDRVHSVYGTGYAMLTLRGAGFEFKPGARYDYFQPAHQKVLDPKGTISYGLDSLGTTIIGGAGRYHRTPDPRQFSSSSGNPYLVMEQSDHYGMGIEQRLFENWTVKIEGYRHYFKNTVVADIYETTPWRLKTFRRLEDVHTRAQWDQYLQDIQDPIKYNAPMGYSNDGTGFSKGYEFYIKRTLPEGKHGLYGWLSYTWSRTVVNDHQHIVTDDEKNMVISADERRVLLALYDNTKDHYASYDRTVVVNLVLGYRINRDWQLGIRWNYRTGEPYTPIIGDDGGRQVNNGRVIFDPTYSPFLYSERFDKFHRLDFRIDRYFNYSWGYGNFFIEMINVYMRDNQTGIYWVSSMPYSSGNPQPQYDLGVLWIPLGKGRHMKIPMVNIGMEVKF